MKIKRALRELFVDLGDYSKTVFLAGTGRSGTTWIENVINYDNSFRVMYEPFHSRKVHIVKEWSYRQYLRPDNREDRFLEPATLILSGAAKNWWIDQLNRKRLVKKRIIKDIRTNLILKWIKAQFPEIPIVLILRHPCAVAASKLKLGWDTHLNDFLTQRLLMHDFLNPFETAIRAAEDPFAEHIFMWCIENYVPLAQFNEGEILVTFYENLCSDPQNEIEKILSFSGVPFSSKALTVSSRPAFRSRKDSAIVAGADLIDSWRHAVDENKIDRGMEILSLFGMHKIYGTFGRPLLSGTEALGLFGGKADRFGDG